MIPEKELIRQCEVKDSTENNFCLNYYMLSTESESCFSNEAKDGILYGIAIKKETLQQGSAINCEEENICGFSYYKEETLRRINMLADMLVTPISLLYIADDFFSKA